ncbi:MAG TPA: TIM-barrel domain-containing protein [Casimicrobiaceae bacterium]|nr:TIM-barrel domain-containing protein [Casimicrobiaceae bacterium]
MQLDPAAYIRLTASSCIDKSASGAAFATSTGDVLEIACFGPGVFRLRVGAHTRPDYGLLVARAQRCEIGAPAQGAWSFAAGETRLELNGEPFDLKLFHAEQPLLSSITDEHFRGFTRLPTIGRTRDGTQWLAAFALHSGQAVYGLGERFGPLNKRGQLVTSQVEDALGVNTGRAYKCTPFWWSPGTAKTGAWGVFVNTPGRVVHGVGYPDWSHRSCVAVVDDEALDLFFIAGRDPAQILDRYTTLTGRAPDVPLWSLGLWVSRAYYRTADEAAAIAEELRARRIPCDVLTLDGRAAWDVQTRFDFRWDETRYPDPAAALERIKRHALKVCVWEYPYVSVHSPLFAELAAQGFLLKAPDGEPGILQWDTAPATSHFSSVLTPLAPSGIVDFTNPGAYSWWRDAHEPLFRAGVDVIKSDFGEHVPADAVAFNGDRGARLHNVYALLYNRCVYEATRKFATADAQAPIVWSRAGWSGSQRYPVHWGGDPQSDWEGLAASIRGGLSWGMSGAAYHATDVGGFYGSEQPSPELYLRWLQMAVFASHMRLHGIGAREPWAFGEEAERIARQWIEFRYRLLPYLQSLATQAAQTGMPVMRAMPLAFPGNALTRGYDTQFMCGDALLVAPIIAPGGEIEVALPPGAWYDLASRQRLAGRQVIRYRAPLERFPVFGREGYALPLGPVVQSTREIDPAAPLDALYLFGKPARALAGFAQASVALAEGEAVVTAAKGVCVEVFGDSTGIRLVASGQ